MPAYYHMKNIGNFAKITDKLIHNGCFLDSYGLFLLTYSTLYHQFRV